MVQKRSQVSPSIAPILSLLFYIVISSTFQYIPPKPQVNSRKKTKSSESDRKTCFASCCRAEISCSYKVNQEEMELTVTYESDLNLKATELRLGLPGTDESDKEKHTTSAAVKNNKRPLAESIDESKSASDVTDGERETTPAAKAQVVGWPPIRSYRKNNFQPKKSTEAETAGIYVKVSMDGAPYLRKIDLKLYKGYPELLKALEDMFKFTIGTYSEREGYNGSEYAPTYEDKDGDWMLVGDVPWNMFISFCRKLRIMKRSEARGLAGV